jgi:hypothetical protein
MKSHSTLLIIIACLAISSGCLAAGYILAGYWLIFLAFPLMSIAWLLTYKRSTYLSASILLSGYVILASVGIIAKLSSALMVIACTAALASWDLLQIDQSASRYSPGKTNGLLEKYHLNSLALAASTGLILSLISANISLQFPFVLIAILVLLAAGSLIYSMQHIVNKRK